jgi:succinate dehydrogenase / fumarate reductase cytochrome b subunit
MALTAYGPREYSCLAMRLLTTSVGRKLVMALSGELLVLFLVVHAIGNSTFWANLINAYAHHLHAVPAVVWVFRAALLALLALHVWQGTTLTLENRAARGGGYAVKAYRRSSVSSRTMIWTGLALALFLVYHELHLTLQVIHPEAAATAHADAAGRPDVQRMLTAGFAHAGTAALYVAAMVALGLHLFHGVASSVQTWGLNGPRSFPWVERVGIALALALAAAFVAIPVAVFAGWGR